MIDYWEAIGRLAYDEELGKGLEKILPPVGEFPYVTAIRENYPCTGVDIPGPLYEAVQRYIEPVLNEQYFSLMAAGELIWVYSHKNIREFMRKMSQIVSEARSKLLLEADAPGMQLSSPSASYFIALGVLVMDPAFRGKVRKHDHQCLTRLHRLPAAQVKHLLAVITDPNFDQNIRLFSDEWPKGCHDDYMFYAGHLHAFAINGPHGQRGKEAAGAAGSK